MNLFQGINPTTNQNNIDRLLQLHNKNRATARLHSEEKVKQLEEENEELRNYINATIEEKAALQIENSNLQQKLESLKLKKHSQEVINHFDLICELLGFSLSDIERDKDNGIKYFKCTYNTDCYARFGISNAGKVELLEIAPTHPNFESIQTKLQVTEDTASLLANLRKYFGQKEKQNTQTGNWV